MKKISRSRALTFAALLAATQMPVIAPAGTVTINLTAGQLLQNNGTAPVADGAIVQVIVLTSGDNFTAPTPASFTGSAGEIILSQFALDSATSGVAGTFLAALHIDTAIFAGLNAGDELLLRWFPNLTTADSAPGFGTYYGEYRTNEKLNNSDIAWIYPADGVTVALNFLTNDVVEGTLDSSFAAAQFQTSSDGYTNQTKFWTAGITDPAAARNGTWNTTDVNWAQTNTDASITAARFVSGDYIQFTDPISRDGTRDDIPLPATIDITDARVVVSGMHISGTGDYTFTGGGITGSTTISGTDVTPDGALRSDTTGTVIFDNSPNAFLKTIITAGTVIFQKNENNLGDISLTPATRADNEIAGGTLEINSSNNTASSVALGTGAQFSVAGNNNSLGPISLAENASANFTGNENILSDITVTGDNATFSISGNNNAAGILALNAAGTFSLAGNANTLGALTLAQGASAEISGDNNALSGDISGTAGGAAFSLSGNNNSAGNINFADNSGVSISGTNTTGNIALGTNSAANISGTNTLGAISLGDNSRLTLAGTNTAGNIALGANSSANISGANTLGIITAGTGSALVFSNTGTLAGLALNGGSLRAGAPLALGQLTGGGTLIFDIDASSTNTTGNYTITVTAGGEINGNYAIQINNTAAVTEETIAKNTSYKLIDTANAGNVDYTTTPASGSEIIVAGAGMTNAHYTLTQTADGLSVAYAGEADFSAAGKAVLVAAGAQAQSWHANLEQLSQRLGELRFTPRKSALQTWARGYGWQLDAQEKVSGTDYQDLAWGAVAGIDEAYPLDHDATGYIGVYMGYGQTRRSAEAVDISGQNDNIYGGIYFTGTTTSGWYADLVFQVNGYSGEFETAGDGFSDSAKFDQMAYGTSLEVGKRFRFESGFFVEPQIQAAYAFITGQDYVTDEQRIAVNQDDTHSLQFRAGVTAGYVTPLGAGHILQIYGRIGYGYLWSLAGDLHVENQSYNPNLDGNRGEAGVGAMWDTGTWGQFYLGYNYVYAAKYEIPWNVNLGYRYQW